MSTFCHFCTGRTTFLAILSKVHGFVEYSDSARHEHVLLSPCWVHHFLVFSAKCTCFCKSEFSGRDQHGFSFLYWAHHFLAIFSNAHEFVQNSVFNPRSACFVIFALGTPLYSDFQQSARVCAKMLFYPKIRMFCHFRTEPATF